MKDLKIKEIIDLATQEVSEPDSELKKVYEWHHDRKMMIIKGSVGIAISLLITLTISYFKSEIQIKQWSMIYPLGFAALSMTYGIYELIRIRTVGKKYIAAITLLNRFKKITPFLELYRRALRNQ